MNSIDWTNQQNDAIVADYFEMLQSELSKTKYNKAAHNRRLQQKIGRSKGSIEFKHQNVSAVLKGLGEVWINGYKPAFNYQASLVEAVDRWLHLHPEWMMRAPATEASFNEASALFLEPPPTLRNVDLSRFDAAPLITFTAPKETDDGTETDGRIPPRRGTDCTDKRANA